VQTPETGASDEEQSTAEGATVLDNVDCSSTSNGNAVRPVPEIVGRVCSGSPENLANDAGKGEVTEEVLADDIPWKGFIGREVTEVGCSTMTPESSTPSRGFSDQATPAVGLAADSQSINNDDVTTWSLFLELATPNEG